MSRASPFLGMDPYLEDPIGWPDVYHELLGAIRSHLADVISPNFYARIEERVYITDPDSDTTYPLFVPDVIVTRGQSQSAAPTEAGAATITMPVEVEIVKMSGSASIRADAYDYPYRQSGHHRRYHLRAWYLPAAERHSHRRR